MPFKIPSLAETRDFLLAVGKAVLPDRNWGNLRSYYGKRTTFLSAAVTQLHSQIATIGKDVHPLTAADNGPIDAWGEVKGITRKGATPARKSAAARVRGTVATAVTAGTQLTHPSSGLLYQIANTTAIGAGEVVDADIVAVSTGTQTRLLAGETLQFVATPVGLETNVVLQKDLDEDGFDTEQFGPYRRRVLAAFSDETSGGSQSDYVAWALEADSGVVAITQAFCYPNRAGFGTIDVAAFHAGSGSARSLTGGEIATLLAFLKTKAPAHIAGVAGALRVLTTVADPQNIEIVLTPNGLPAYAFDWTGGPLTVLAWTPATRALQFTTALPATMKAGHRGSFRGVASAQDGTEFKIEAIAASDTIILEAAPAVAPAATDQFYSGGPLVTPVRDAIVGHLNGETVYAGAAGVPLRESAVDSTVGLEILADGLGPANPLGVYGTWSGGIIRAVLGKIAIYKAGVRNYTIATPAADYEALDDAFPNDGQVHFVAPNAVLVRGAT